MFSLTFKEYEKMESITQYIGYFFIALGLVFLYIQPEPFLLGFWICLIIAVSALVVAIYNDVQHKKYDNLKKRGINAFGVMLLTAVYFLFLYFQP